MFEFLPMASPRVETRLMKPNDNKDAKKLRSILFDSPTQLTLTPIQVLVFSMSFIFMTFALHVLSKIFPSISSTQMFVSMALITVSVCISLGIRKNK